MSQSINCDRKLSDLSISGEDKGKMIINIVPAKQTPDIQIVASKKALTDFYHTTNDQYEPTEISEIAYIFAHKQTLVDNIPYHRVIWWIHSTSNF